MQEDAFLPRGELGDVPGPHLVGPCCGERGLHVRVCKPLISALFDSASSASCVFRCIRSGVPGASDHSFRRIRSETGAERRAG